VRVTEGLRGVSVSLTIALSALFLLNGCSTLSRQLNSLKELHGQRKFADMVESEENCEEERPECAQINLLLADAHLQLGHISQASIDADSALRLPEKDRRPQDTALAYEIKGIAALRGTDDLKSPDQRAFLLADAEGYLLKSLQFSRQAGNERSQPMDRFLALENLCEIYARWGIVSSGSEARSLDGKLASCARDLKNLNSNNGIGDYYLHRARLRALRGKVTEALFGGAPQQKEEVAAELQQLLKEVQVWGGKFSDSRYAQFNKDLLQEIQQQIAGLRR